ncbi:RagB/SusD family nutrient uptake outer membrane protein [Pedobacter panaciterrae]|jgi:SusD family.|uniref:RagB/SusD family nutrient uptake outer membrane protein n=1 Tax=Pedobacter panaciterrae TaxID=363849 RepID=UPI00155DDD9B|nr:RagB/SusD family nutrient uptake outer membrane protein [Pedobacter panaciterrae]NQX52800.1 RagB/SusD family nutrient uptake outer membrane protein [Pedobacter panaciterrae]
MKKFYLIIIISVGLSACNKLDLNPLSEASTGNFYSNQTELELAVNDLYRLVFWGNDNELFGDNEWHRGQLTNAVIGGTMNADDAAVQTYWLNCYKAIARANSFLANKDKAAANTPAAVMLRLEAEMRLIRANQYAKLVTHFGDVPLLTTTLTLEESYGITRTGKDQVLDFIFKELDFAIANLPETYAQAEVKRLTKGAALAVKARTALYVGKYDVARDAAKAVMDLGAANVYSLNASYSQLFLKAGETSKELIISIPRDQAQQVFNGAGYVQDNISRNAGGFGAQLPTRDIVDAYECTDGKPIDESPLYDPKQPFKNRDPRLTATVVEFNTQWLGYNYTPHPDSLTVYSSKQNKSVSNKDSRAVAAFASYTGFLWKKGIDQTWADRLAEDNDAIIIRYAEMLLTYAEAKVELGEANATVLDAINQVRARAYGVTAAQTTLYPAVTTTDLTELRKVVRRERRVEFAKEGLRYMDLIRWHLAEKALTKPVIGLPDPANQNRSKWPFPGITPLDDDGIADYSGFGSDVKALIERKFDKNKQYLWPIPAVERRVNPNITQNLNY